MHEPEVLEGMRNCIATGLPSIIIEVLNNDLGKRVLEALNNHGYLCYSLIGYKQMRQVKVIDVVPEMWNYFFCQPQIAAKLGAYIV